MPLVLQPNLKQSEIDKNMVADIAVKLSIARPLAEVLYTRGYNTVEKAIEYFDEEVVNYKNPFLLSGMAEAVDVLRKAISENKCITVYGDYDVDGVCSVAIIYLTIRALGGNIQYYIPDRHCEGYGLNSEAINSIAERGGVLITVDCGITSVDEVRHAKELGLEVIITDHHSLQSNLPDCIIINPKIDSPYSFKELCGAGVAFKVAHALLEKDEFADAISDLACIATIADIVPLVDENRYIVKRGLELINTRPRPGVLELIRACGKDFGEISERDIAFGIAPRLNAAGRLESAEIALKILLGENISDNVERVCVLNTKRQELEQLVVEEAEQIALKSGQIRNRKVIIAASEKWDKGVIGIAASKLTEKYHRPCLLFSVSGGIATGSGRSIDGVNLFEALSSCNTEFIKFGGHAMAAGLSLVVDNLDELSDELNLYMINNAEPKCFYPVAKYDAKICLAEMNATLVEQMRVLAPFGVGNPMPKFRVDGLRPTVSRVVGKNRNHLKITLSDDATVIESMLFSYRNSGINIKNDFDYTVVGYPEINNWNDIQRVNLILSNVKADRNYPLIKDAIIHNDDLIFRAFFEQIMYDTDTACDDFQHIENKSELIELIDSLLFEDDSGTIIISNQPADAIKISKHVFENHPRCDIDLLNTSNDISGYNTLLIGGSIKKINFDSYRNVVLCDCANYQMIDYINNKFPHADIFAYMDNAKTLLNCCRTALRNFSRDNMIKVYLAIKKRCAESQDYDCKESFLRVVSITSGASTCVVDVALEIFLQLGFIQIRDEIAGFNICVNANAPQNALTNSSIYSNILKQIGV